MKIFAAGIATETNTFSPIPTSLEDFLIERGRDAQNDGIRNANLDLSEVWGKLSKNDGHAFVFSLMAFAQPSGPTVTSAYETLRDEILRDLHQAMPVDVVLLMLHGAMIARNYGCCEADIAQRVREIVGPRAVIGIELDLHCHLTEETVTAADIVITYKEYPHIDVNRRAEELYTLCVKTKAGEIHPTMALFDCRMLGLYPTSREPLRQFVDSMRKAEQEGKALSLSFAHGFQFADTPAAGAKFLAITDDDLSAAKHLAADFGHRVYAMRHQIGFESQSMGMRESLQKALASADFPVVVADQSDNPGGGAPGDATFVLRWLLEHNAQEIAMAIFYDPEVVRIARRVGPGGQISVRLGGKLGPTSGNPVDLEATVLASLSNYQHGFPLESGEFDFTPIGDVVALRCAGIDIVVASQRCQCFAPSIFTDLGIDPRTKRVLIPKSTQHFYGAFSPIAKEIIYMAAPGAVPPDPRIIKYRHLDTSRFYPFVPDPLEVGTVRISHL